MNAGAPEAVSDDSPGYASASEHLADHAERLALLVDRYRIERSAVGDAPVLSDERRRARLRTVASELVALGERLDALDARIERRVDHARRLGVVLPLEQLRERLGLTPLDVAIVGAVATIERGAASNAATGAMWREGLQPDVSIFVALLADGERVSSAEARLRFAADAPLVTSGVVVLAGEGGGDAPLIHKRLRLADRVLDFLEGAADPPPSVLGAAGRFVRSPVPAARLLLARPEVVDEVARALADPAQLAVLVGARGVGRRSVVGAAAAAIGRPLVIVDLTELPVEARELGRALAPLVREARLQGAVLVLAECHLFADGEGQQPLWSHLVDALRGLRLPLALVGERPPKWLVRVDRMAITFELPFPSGELQRRQWVRCLPADLRLDEGLAIDALVRRYALSFGSIEEAAEELARLDRVHARGGLVQAEELAHVVRRRLAHRLGALATPVRTTLDWKDVILPDEVLDRVFEFLDYAAHRERVMTEWGFGRKLPYGRGLSALFAGPPGTGKTMICSLLAKELGVELYRIDLSQVVNKYIGETEKNLGRVFDEAAHGQVMLLFDEADSIFAKRTEVKSSHDRYANLEVNYLLQRMENFDGIVVLTTNSETAIDPAFRRRIRFRVRFPAPDEKHREQLWRGMIPAETAIEGAIDFATLARRFPLAGGNIMNAVVRAAIAASADGTSLEHKHLLRAAELEYAEMGFLS